MWRWADDQGEQRLVGAEELRTAIANGVLSPSTLVWREGMSAWVPALSVAEFADAVPRGGEARAAGNPQAASTAQASPANVSAPAANTPARANNAAPARATLQGLANEAVVAARAAVAAAAPAAAATPSAAAPTAAEQAALKEKRTPSVAPPRPNPTSVKPAGTRTVRANAGPAIPPAPRLPSDGPAKPSSPAAPRAVATLRPAPPVPAPAPRAPSTTAIDKEWSITDDETTNVPGKDKSVPTRPPPPVETPQREVPSPRAAAPQMQPSRASVVRSAPPPSPHAERRPTEESTESTTFQFAQNALSLRAGMPAPPEENGPMSGPTNTEAIPRIQAPPGLMESYAKQPVATHEAKQEDPPPTASSPEYGDTTEDLEPAYVRSTVRMDKLPDPPKVREPTATAMFPVGFDDGAGDDGAKRPHEVSRTIRLAADFLGKVLNPKGRFDSTKLGDVLQMKPPPIPPSGGQADGALQPQFTRLPSTTSNAGTSLPLRQGQPGAPAPGVPTQLPLNALLMSGALLITMVIGAFFVGRCSVKSGSKDAPTARAGIGIAVKAIQEKLPGPPKPCWVAKQPTRYAPVVSKSIPFDLLALTTGKVAIGYAKSDDEAVGIEITPSTGQVDEDYVDKAQSEIARVTPTGKGFFISTVEPPGSLRSLIPISAEKPFYLGISEKHIAISDQPSGVATRIWPLADDPPPGGFHVLTMNNRSIVVALRTGPSRQRKVLAGMIGADRKAVTNLVNVPGSGGQASEPMLGSNGREVAVVFADQAGESGPLKVRIGHAPIGKIPGATTVFETPGGGPGGDANHPAIAGLPDGRWVMMWTEGSSGFRAVRAQTFGSNFTAVGDPIVLSPPSGNFGQGMLGVVGNYVSVVFVQRGRSTYELWGSVLQCGS
jgi:hypothetical protein